MKYTAALLVCLICSPLFAVEPDFSILGSTVSFTILGGDTVVQPKPTKVIPTKPVGSGWNWDDNRGVWWRAIENPVTIQNPFFNSNCPSGNCPNQRYQFR
jgi:hypothetical protein